MRIDAKATVELSKEEVVAVEKGAGRTRGAEEETEGKAEARKRKDRQGCYEVERMTNNREAG